MTQLQLGVCNLSAMPDHALALLQDLASRGLLDAPRAMSRRYLTLNLPYTDGGTHRVLQDVIEAWLAGCADPAAPSVRELERLLATVPELRDAYELDIEGQTWRLRARPTRPRRRGGWTDGSWQFVFTAGDRRHVFPVAGDEFDAMTRLFQYLNGTHTARQLGAELPQHRPLIKRFLAFARAHRLFVSPRRAPRPRPGVEFVSHSSLQFTGREASILVDPCFLLTSERDRRRFDAKFRQLEHVSAVLLTHAHWDHAHLPTLFRFRRDLPIFVPRVREETYYNPALAPQLRSLGFTDVREVTLWKPERIGDVTFTPIPFFGEWFGPGSRFDAFCYLVEVDGVRFLGTVDSERDEHGNMDPVFDEVRRRIGPIDCVFFCSSAQTHANPVLCGAPAQYSNGFDVHAERMRYHPDTDAIVRWSRVLEPRVVIPYAEFLFAATTARKPIALDEINAKAHFRDYWRDAGTDPELLAWKRVLAALPRRLPSQTQLMMMSPGERVAISRRRRELRRRRRACGAGRGRTCGSARAGACDRSAPRAPRPTGSSCGGASGPRCTRARTSRRADPWLP
jgi:L-ascorbate metabolism protein UlaG (beta-lactamase superfamily)